MAASSSTKATKRSKGRGVPPSANPPLRADSLSVDRRNLLLCCLALIAAVFVFYSPVVHNEFVHYDDHLYITDNPHVKAGVTWTTVAWAFTTYDQANWHPLTWLSHALDCELFGLNPVGHHLVNVLLHGVNAVLLFLLLQSATGFRWRSLMVAALFALHTINVESVAWAAERKNVLSMLFFLLALYAYGWYARDPGPRHYMAAALCYALALMAKPQVITFPFLLLLWDYWPLGRMAVADGSASAAGGDRSTKSQISRLIVEKVPLLVLSAASALLTMEAQRAGGAVRNLTRYSLPVRLETALIAYVSYVGKMFWPVKLAAIYPHPIQLYPAWQVDAAALLLLLITAVVLAMREKRYLATGWLWFLGSLVPMIGVVQVGDQAMADRYAYIPFVGLFVMMVWLVADWADAGGVSARWLAIPAVACLLVLGILTYRQVPYWHDTEELWRRTVEMTEDNYIAHGELAGLLHRQGKNEEALAHLRAVVASRPDDAAANLVLGDDARSHGDFTAAIAHYQTVARRSTYAGARVRAYAGLGSIYRQMGQLRQAKESLEESLQLSPNEPDLLIALGVINETSGDLPAAVQQYSHAIAVHPTDVEYLLLSHALQQEGRADEANQSFQRASGISANLPRAEQHARELLSGR